MSVTALAVALETFFPSRFKIAMRVLSAENKLDEKKLIIKAKKRINLFMAGTPFVRIRYVGKKT
jgi:uncharacterized membrane protein YqhA